MSVLYSKVRTMAKKHDHLDKLVPALYDRWMAGERYPSLAREAGVPIGTLRHRFVTRARGLDGKDGYRKAVALRDQLHPRPKVGPQRQQQERPDDSEVFIVTSTRIVEGWHTYRVNTLADFVAHSEEEIKKVGAPYDVLVAPDGITEYVTADEYEPADLIVAYDGLSPWRLKLRPSAEPKPKRKHRKVRSMYPAEMQVALGV